MRLEIELVPETCWGSNIRTTLKKSDWDKIRKAVYAKQDMFCYTCDEKCKTLDAHEVWEYDEKNHIQKLIDIIGVCKKCHNVIHYGRAQKIGFEKEAQEQFLKVNDCDLIDLEIELLRVTGDFAKRSKINNWKLDLSLLEERGYTISID